MVPFVKLPTVQLRPTASVVQVRPPGFSVAVYPVTALPPLEYGSAHDTVAVAFPADADTDAGADA
ncbi:unannotated protein [freshwater metagenome]|uniref:Unannotated protein n=1 Tax=freshwater metagenome TaxID=449393 RepID=A0A6J7Q3S9_9ZZZZ